ncbi:hypothetical protein HPB48_020504 [Haemaphysalis longicornis]|uniref:Sulfotransferase domain-containing protein n=1 Tax=Haemaphysalis longicornis TaxID=44386 RepID=A0A9J6GA57_HAELO|nr:hypothetical protein HPB48_020504 [Haemaphysalis longicornis]
MPYKQTTHCSFLWGWFNNSSRSGYLASHCELLSETRTSLFHAAGAIKTHMLYDEKRMCPEAKYVCVMRNPFDCCVSFYHHYKMYPIYGFENGTFEDFLQLFLEGDVDGGDYFDHLLSWYPHRNDSNVLCLRFVSFLT